MEIRAAGVEWKRDDGIFVGSPHREFGASIYHRDFVSQLDKEEVRKSLEGQKLYVTPGDVKDALWLIHEFGIKKGDQYHTR